ncbi:MAG TPA: ribosome-associated translation inhibitor RaiA [Acidimicrobiia bacterium]|nr:ribosome-associated translation inhibitor RaiA [Acidimicrobiia bacterium]
MEVRVHTRNAVIGDATRVAAMDKITRAARVFEDQLTDVDVELAEEHNPRLAAERYRLEVTTTAAGRLIRIVTTAASPEAAVDLAVERLNRQLLRLKKRLIGRSRKGTVKEPVNSEPPEADSEIVRIKQFVMKPMTVEEASLQMELLGHDFFFFHNQATGLQSVLYRRRDGNLGLIEPA